MSLSLDDHSVHGCLCTVSIVIIIISITSIISIISIISIRSLIDIMIIATSIGTSEEDVERLVDAMDVDGDGKVTYQEYLNSFRC